MCARVCVFITAYVLFMFFFTFANVVENVPYRMCYDYIKSVKVNRFDFFLHEIRSQNWLSFLTICFLSSKNAKSTSFGTGFHFVHIRCYRSLIASFKNYTFALVPASFIHILTEHIQPVYAFRYWILFTFVTSTSVFAGVSHSVDVLLTISHLPWMNVTRNICTAQSDANFWYAQFMTNQFNRFIFSFRKAKKISIQLDHGCWLSSCLLSADPLYSRSSNPFASRNCIPTETAL